MLIILRVLFHFICSIGRFFRKIFQLIFGRRHEGLEMSQSKTEPVTLEHIRIISEMENDSSRPYQSFTSAPKVNEIIKIILFFFFYISYHQPNGILGVQRIYFDKNNFQIIHQQMNKLIILVILQQQLRKHLK
jgi:hypothetical protein